MLHEILAQEYVSDTFHIHQWAVFIRHEARCEFSSLLGVHTHNVTQKRCIIRCVAHLLRIQNDLVKLARLSETSHDLVGDIRAQVHTQGQTHVLHAHDITQLFAALDLVFFEPLLEQVLAPLRQDRLGKLQRLVLV